MQPRFPGRAPSRLGWAATIALGCVTLSAAHAAAQEPPNVKPGQVTTDTGRPVPSDDHSETAGAQGPTLLKDFYLLEKLAHFDRERIPERVVHARGVGARGVFVSAGDFSAMTKAAFLSARASRRRSSRGCRRWSCPRARPRRRATSGASP